jgi:hypothetical protein
MQCVGLAAVTASHLPRHNWLYFKVDFVYSRRVYVWATTNERKNPSASTQKLLAVGRDNLTHSARSTPKLRPIKTRAVRH